MLRREKTSVLVTLLGNAPMAGKYDQMVVLVSALCWRLWMKRWGAAETGSLCLRLVDFMAVESPGTLFLCVSRKRVTARSWRKNLGGGALGGVTPSLSWNCMSLERNLTIRWCELVIVYLHDCRKKNRTIWMMLAEHCAKGQEGAAASAETMTSSIGMDFITLTADFGRRIFKKS